MISRSFDAAGTGSASSARYMVGTPPSTLACARLARNAAPSGRAASSRRAFFIKASSAAHRPKTKFNCSGSSTQSSAVMPSSRSSTASFAAKRACASTTPLGIPVEPEVKITSAASRNSGRCGGGAWPTTSRRPPSTANRAPVKPCTRATVEGAAAMCSGTATAPARHTPSSAPMSDGRLPMRSSTGSSGATPLVVSSFPMRPASASNSAGAIASPSTLSTECAGAPSARASRSVNAPFMRGPESGRRARPARPSSPRGGRSP